jgi:hypothetical protein
MGRIAVPFALSAAAGLAAITPAAAAVQLDQEAIITPAAGFPALVAQVIGEVIPPPGVPLPMRTFTAVQTITAGLGGYLDHVDFQIARTASPGTVVVSLFDGDPRGGGAPVHVLGAPSAFLPDQTAAFNAATLFSVDLRSDDFALAPGQVFAIGFQFIPDMPGAGAPGARVLGVVGRGTPPVPGVTPSFEYNAYAGGDFIVFADGSASGVVLRGDIGFRSYVDVRDLPPAAVPEPASWALMIGGFALAGGALRRRRSGRPTAPA